MSKKLVSAALTATTLLWAVGVAALPVANAQTSSSTASLQAEIASLLAQIAQLQSQMGTSSTSSTTTSSYSFSKDLTLGSKGADVTVLQQLLINKGDLTALSAPTGYFGTATQAALAKFQTANAISPAAGYFGPKTRAFVNSMTVGTSTTTTTTTGTQTTTTTTGTQTTTSVAAPATGLAVSVASDNPATGSIISSGSTGGGSAARVPVLGVNFTAGNSGAVTISDVKVHKVGVLSDSSVSGAYLVQNGQVVAQYNSINSGVIDFSGLQLSIPAGQTLDLQVAIDPAAGLQPGNTVSFSMNAASDVTAFDVNNNSITPAGSFPINGNVFTVTSVTNPSLASLAIGSTSIATQVTAGTQGNIVGAWNFNVGNNRVYLEGISFHVIGSANKGDLRNVKLVVNGTQAGATLPTVPANGIAYFNMSTSSASLNTGSNNVQVFADVMGSPSYNFQFEVLNSYDVLAIDSQYNVPIAVTNRYPATTAPYTTGVGTQVSIQTGTITTSQDSATPTGNVAVGQSGVTLAKFDIYAGGEAVKIEYLDFSLAFQGVSATTSIANEIRNVQLTDDAGGQVGTTINTPPSGNTCTVAASSQNGTGLGTGLTSLNLNPGSDVYGDCFGTSSSNINYVVPANTTRVLSLKADIQSAANFSNVTASLLGENGNLQGLTSSQSGSSSGASGSALSLTQSLLGVSQNNALASPVNVTANSSHVEIGSYNFQASSASGVQVNTLTFTMGQPVGGGTTSTFQNVGVWVNGTQFGTTQGVVTPGQAVSFSGSPFTVPAGQSVNVNVYGDILSSGVSTNGAATTLTGCSGTGVTSYNAITCSSANNNAPAGQQVTIAGASAILISSDGSQPSAGQIVMGSTGNVLAIYRFTETANAENVKVTQLPVVDVVTPTSSKASFSNLTLWNGSTLLGSVGTPATTTVGSTSTTYLYNFQIQGNPIVVPQANSISITLKGDASPYSVGATDNGTNQFIIATSTTGVLTALGQSSNLAATPTISGAAGNSQTVLRTILTPSVNNTVADGSYFTPSNHQSRQTSDDLAEIKLATNNSGGAILSHLMVSFSGSLASTTLPFLQNVQLLDSNGNNLASVDGAKLSTSTTGTVTYTGTTTATGTVTVYINGQPISTASINTGSSSSSVATAVVTAIGTVIPGVTAAAGSGATAGVVTVTDSQGAVYLSVPATSVTGITEVAAAGAGVSCSSSVSTCYVTWVIPTSTVQAQISAGGTGLFKLRINDQDGQPAVNNTSLSLSASIQNPSDVQYYDSLDSLANLITSVPSNIVPLSVASFALPLGN